MKNRRGRDWKKVGSILGAAILLASLLIAFGVSFLMTVLMTFWCILIWLVYNYCEGAANLYLSGNLLFSYAHSMEEKKAWQAFEPYRARNAELREMGEGRMLWLYKRRLAEEKGFMFCVTGLLVCIFGGGSFILFPALRPGKEMISILAAISVFLLLMTAINLFKALRKIHWKEKMIQEGIVLLAKLDLEKSYCSKGMVTAVGYIEKSDGQRNYYSAEYCRCFMDYECAEFKEEKYVPVLINPRDRNQYYVLLEELINSYQMEITGKSKSGKVLRIINISPGQTGGYGGIMR